MENIVPVTHHVDESLIKEKKGGRLLKLSGKIWFIVAVLGQWVFASYVAIFYGGTALQGNLAAWSDALPTGITKGDAAGNFALAGHLLLAVFITIGGPLQFIPQIRKRALSFHRWNGKVYMIIVLITSFFGMYMLLTRGTVGGFIMHLGLGFNALLIVVFVILAWRFAMLRKFQKHGRWAMRLFLTVSGVWFFRVGLMLWIAINGGPVGFDIETFEGPFLSFWTFGQYLLPLAILELYFLAKDKASHFGRIAMAIMLFIATLAMAVGIAVATVGMWLPSINEVY